MTISEKSNQPVWIGAKKYINEEGGFALWLPSNWKQIDMTEGHNGAIFTPFEDHYNTCIAVEKHNLPIEVKVGDASTLRKGLEEGLNALPGIEIESIVDSVASKVLIFDVKYSFLEGEERRKRWLRNIYWNEGQLVLIAQGQSVKDYDFWMPVFFNVLMTAEVGKPS